MKEKKPTIVGDNTIQAEDLVSFLDGIEKASAKGGKKFAMHVVEILGRALEIGAKLGNAALSVSAADLSRNPDVINFCHAGKGLYLPNFE